MSSNLWVIAIEMAGNFQVVAVEFVNNRGADGVSYANEDGQDRFCRSTGSCWFLYFILCGTDLVLVSRIANRKQVIPFSHLRMAKGIECLLM